MAEPKGCYERLAGHVAACWSAQASCVRHRGCELWHGGEHAHACGASSDLQASAWSSCNVLCGPAALNYRTRTVQCTQLLPGGAVAVVDRSVCVNGGLPTPATSAQCSAVQCTGLFWQPATDWGPCSTPCTSNPNNASTLGTTTSSPPTCMMSTVNGSSLPTTTTLCVVQLPVRLGVRARTGLVWHFAQPTLPPLLG